MGLNGKGNNRELRKWAQENITNEPGEKHLGKEEVAEYEQLHLALVYSNGGLNNYLQSARLKMAEKAQNNGCICVVDGDDCQNYPKEYREIFVCTGLRPKSLKSNKSLDNKLSPEDFLKFNMSHIEKEEFLRRMGDSSDNYNSINLHSAHQGALGEDYLRDTELKLARRALGKGCSYVTNMDYTAHHPQLREVAISAKGLIKKK